MSFESIICRRSLDDDRGNPWICECPLCRDMRAESESKEPKEIVWEAEANPGEKTG